MRMAVLSLLVVMGCGSSSGPRIECPAGTRPEKNDYARGCKLSDGTWHGPFASLYKNGKRRRVGQYDQGVPDGTWTAYGPDGKVLGTYEVVDGTGVERVWHPNGQLAAEIPYRDGRREGVSRRWHDNGQKSSETTMVDGRAHGQTVRWSATGTRLSQQRHEHGRAHGVARTWDDSGALIRETEYFHGSRIRETVYEDGQAVSEQTWDLPEPGDRIGTRDHPRIDASWQRCTEHHECELVSFRCCACGAGDHVAVNFRYTKQARERLRRECKGECPSMLCQRVDGRCEDGSCASAE